MLGGGGEVGRSGAEKTKFWCWVGVLGGRGGRLVGRKWMNLAVSNQKSIGSTDLTSSIAGFVLTVGTTLLDGLPLFSVMKTGGGLGSELAWGCGVGCFATELEGIRSEIWFFCRYYIGSSIFRFFRNEYGQKLTIWRCLCFSSNFSVFSKIKPKTSKLFFFIKIWKIAKRNLWK